MDVSYCDDANLPAATRTQAQEDKASQAQKDASKSESDATLSDNRLLKTERALAASLILQRASAESRSLLDAYIKQSQSHWRMSVESNKLTSAVDLLSFGVSASSLSLLSWSHSTSSHGAQTLADVALIKPLRSMKQMDHEAPTAFSQRVAYRSKQSPSERSSIVSDKTLRAIVYAGPLPR